MARVGYGFAGWSTAADGSGMHYGDGAQVHNLSSINGAVISLYAVWQGNVFTLTLDPNGGSPNSWDNVAKPPVTYSGSQVIYHMVAGSSIHLPDTFTFVRTGYTMDGWVDKPNGDKVIAPGSRYWMPGGSVVLYAHWVPNSYIIRFQPGAVDVLGYEDMVDVRINYDTHAYLPSNTMTREGYRFVGWTSDYGSFSNCGEVYNLTTVNDKVITLTAVWQALPHTVTFNGGEGGTLSGVANPQTVNHGGHATTPNAYRQGYVLIGWSYSMEINGGQTLTGMTDDPSSIEILGDTTFTAYWGGPSAVVYLPGNHGSFASHSKDPGSQTLYTDLPFGAMGDQYAYRGPTGTTGLPLGQEGWTFTGWVRTAYDNDGHKIGESYFISAETWVRDKTGSLGFIDEGEYTIYFTAQWYKPFKLTYDLNGGGEWVKDYDFGYTTDGVSDPVSMMVGAGETVHIPTKDALIRPGYIFNGWATSEYNAAHGWVTYPTYDEDGNVVNLYTMPEHDVTFYAVWTIRTYNVHYATGTGTYIGVQKFTYNDTGLLPSPNPVWPGYTFNNWYTEDNSNQSYGDVPHGDRVYNSTHLYEILPNEEVTDIIIYAWFVPGYANIYYFVDQKFQGGTLTNMRDSGISAFDGVPTGSTAVPDAGYEFIGWYDAKGRLVGTEAKFVPTKSPDTAWLDGTVYYARFQYKQYSIIFNNNNGQGGLPNQRVAYDEYVTLTPNANRITRPGFEFLGWATGQIDPLMNREDLQQAIADRGLSFLADQARVVNLAGQDSSQVTLWAVWLNVGWKVHYDLDGQNDYYWNTNKDGRFLGWIAPEDNDRIHQVGVKVNALTYEDTHGAHRNGYKFIGWQYLTEAGTWQTVNFGAEFTMPNHDVTFKPIWEAIKYTVIFDPGLPEGYDISGAYASDSNLNFTNDGKPYFQLEVSFDELFDAGERYYRSGFDFLKWIVTGSSSWGTSFSVLDGEYDAGWYKNFCNVEGGIVTFTAKWSGKKVTAIFESTDPTQGTVTGDIRQQLYAGDNVRTGTVYTTPGYKKALSYWKARVTLFHEDGTSYYEYHDIKPSDLKDYVLQGDTTFTAYWTDAFDVWFFEGEYGDFYSNGGHDAGHTGGEEGKTRFTHAVGTEGIPTYAGMWNGLPRSTTYIDANRRITYAFKGWALAAIGPDGLPLMEDGHAVYRTMEDGKTPMYLYGPDGLPVTAADLSSLILIDKLKELGLEGTGNLYLVATWEEADYTIYFESQFPPQPSLPSGFGSIDLNTGTMPIQQMAYETEVALAPNQYAAVGYEFIGWSTKALSEIYDGKTYFDYNVTLDMIKEQVNSANARFYANMALFGPKTAADFEVEPGSITLYAIWRIQRYEVTFLTSGDNVGGIILDNDGNVLQDGHEKLTQWVVYNTHPRSEKIPHPSQPGQTYDLILHENPGYAFAGWDYEVTLPNGQKFTGFFESPDGIPGITVYGRTIVRAVWEKLHTITYNPGDHGAWAENTIVSGGLRADKDYLIDYVTLGGKTDPNFTTPLDYGDGKGALVRTMPVSNSDEWMFDGWVSNDGRFFQTVEDVLKALMGREDIILTANWLRKPVTVHFDPNGGTSVAGSTALNDRTDLIPYQQIVLPFVGTVTKAGYELYGWSYDGKIYRTYEESSDVFIVPRFGATLTAVWQEITVFITFKSEGTNTTGAGYIVSDQGTPMCTYNRWGQITGYYYGINGVPVVKREGAHTGYVYNPAVNGGAAMYPQTFDTLRMRLSSITGETRGYLYDYRYNTYFDTPISITAIARQGYHFLHWVDSHGVIVCEDATFVAPAGSSGVWAETTYYAIFTEDQDVMIKYQVSDPDHAWLSRDKESVAPSTGRALGTEVHLLPGYRVVGWAVDWDGGDLPSIDELIELGKIIFNPPRYGEGLAGAQIFYDPADPLKGGHTYTAIIEPAEDVEFTVNHHFQSSNGVTFELKKTDEYKWRDRTRRRSL